MKKIIYITIIALSASLCGCNDYLTVESPDQLTSDKFWRDTEDALGGLSAAYSQLEFSTSSWQMAEVKWPVEAYREDIVKLGSDAQNYKSWLELSNFTYNRGNEEMSLYWRNNYRGANYSNQVITKVPTIPEGYISEEDRAQIINEAHFLRAYYHLKLILNWEEIIVRDEYVSVSNLNKAVSSREETWDFIIEDLKKATALPTSHPSENLGRATRGAAYAYLGLANLTRAYEESSKKSEYLDAAIKAFENVKGYELEKNFVSMFDGTNKNCKESIFELQFSMNDASGAYYKHQIHKWLGASEVSGWDEILPTTMLVNTYKKEGKISSTGEYDARLYQTLFFRDDYYNDGTGKIYGVDYDELFVRNEAKEDEGPKWVVYDKPIFRKYLPSTWTEMKANYTAINLPLMRYANVLLLHAEALNEAGQTDKAIPLINQVREVHGDMPAMTGSSADDVRKQIEHERILEFPLENWRWYDLRRWGKLSEAMSAAGKTFNEATNSFYPIPETEANSNSMVD